MSNTAANAPYVVWQCATCGEIYDEALGSADTGIPPGTRFADLPDDWICPVCGAVKGGFAVYIG